MKPKRCKCGCGHIIKGHPNKKFLNTKHKDKYHNRVNPRGYFAPKKTNETLGHIGHKIDPIEDSMHPYDPYSLGQE